MKFLPYEKYRQAAHEVFEDLEKKIQAELPYARIEHIGSSAVPGMISKGDLDIYVGVPTCFFNSALNHLLSLGLKIKMDTYRSEALCMLECDDYDIDTAVQLVDNSSEHVNFLTFRDALLADTQLVKTYNKLKRESTGLAPDKYRERKSRFIRETLDKGTVFRLNQKERDFWNSYVKGCEVPPKGPKVRAGIPGDEDLADELLELYLDGKKTAASGLVKDYEAAGDEMPQVGEYWIILNSAHEPGCIVKTVRVEFFPFDQVPEKVAAAEGEGDLSFEYWRKAHREFFAPELKRLAINDLDKELVVVEYFELVFP